MPPSLNNTISELIAPATADQIASTINEIAALSNCKFAFPFLTSLLTEINSTKNNA